MDRLLGLTRRSFLKASTAAATFVLASAVNPIPGLAKSMVMNNRLEEAKILERTDPEVLLKSGDFIRVQTHRAEKAFLLGIMYHLRKVGLGDKEINLIVRPHNIDSNGKALGYIFDGKVGVYGDRCTLGFQTDYRLASDFEYMRMMTGTISKGIQAYFEMSDIERTAGQIDGRKSFSSNDWRKTLEVQ